MGKQKGPKEGKNSKSHIKARMDFLEKAANYLQTTATNTTVPAKTDEREPQTEGAFDKEEMDICPKNTLATITKEKLESESKIQNRQIMKTPLMNLSRVYMSHMRGVSLKTLTRLPIPTKRSFCKRCETPLSHGVTCSEETQNASRGGKKPWADVRVVRCLVCGTERRFPQTDRKSKKLVERKQQKVSQVQAQAQNQNQNQDGIP